MPETLPPAGGLYDPSIILLPKWKAAPPAHHPPWCPLSPQIQQLCCALSWVSDHHHNLLALVQLFLDVTSRSRWVRLSPCLLTSDMQPRPCDMWGAGIQVPPRQSQQASHSHIPISKSQVKELKIQPTNEFITNEKSPIFLPRFY